MSLQPFGISMTSALLMVRATSTIRSAGRRQGDNDFALGQTMSGLIKPCERIDQVRRAHIAAEIVGEPGRGQLAIDRDRIPPADDDHLARGFNMLRELIQTPDDGFI